jgi:hypothetical protein
LKNHNTLDVLNEPYKIPPHLPCLPAGRLFQREEKSYPPLEKRDSGGFNKLFQRAKVLRKIMKICVIIF